MKKNHSTPNLEKQFDRIIEANNNPKPKPEKRTYRKSIGMTKKDKLLINKFRNE